MEEIRQNGNKILCSEDGLTIKTIFRNLYGHNIHGRAYKNYINSVAIPGGFVKGEIELYKDGILVERGNIN